MAPKRRRARGEGAVFRRASDGLWVGVLDLGVVDGRRRRKAVYGQSEREVLQKLNTLRTAHDRGIDLLAPALTVGQWLDVWLSDIKGFDGTRPRTLTLYEGLADRYVMPVIGGLRLDKLTPAHVQRLVTETRNGQTSRGTPPSASTLRHVYKLIRNALGDAYRMELVTRNVATQVKAPPIDRQRRVGLDVAEAERFEVISGERLEALYVLALMTGLRRGELLALRWDDIDFGSRQLHVCRAMQRVAANFRLSSRRPAARGGRWCCPGSRCAISRSTRNGSTLSARRSVTHGGSTGWCSPRPSARRSSRATSTGAGMSCGGRLACPGSGCMTCGTGVPRCCLRRAFRIGSLWRCSGTRRSVSR